jgi:hypothetical protein
VSRGDAAESSETVTQTDDTDTSGVAAGSGLVSNIPPMSSVSVVADRNTATVSA